MNSIYSVEQVNIPPELGTILKQYTKAVIRDKPSDVYKYSANFFAMLSGKPIPFEQDGQPAAGTFDGKSIFSNDPIAKDNERPGKTPDHGDAVEVSEEEAVNMIFARYDTNNEGTIQTQALPSVLNDIKEALGLGEEDLPRAEEILSMLNASSECDVRVEDLKQLLFETAGEDQ